MQRCVEVDVDARVPIVRILLGLPLNPTDDALLELDHVGHDPRLVEVFLDRRSEIVPTSPVLVYLGCLAELREGWDVSPRGNSEAHEPSLERVHHARS